MAKGWIKLHRSLQDCSIWASSEPYDMRSAWVDLLMLANHEDKDVLFNYKPLTIMRGQYLTSVRQLGARWSWSKNRVLKYLRLLEKLKMIERESDKQRTLLTVVNYGIYQDGRDTGVDTGMDTGMDTGVPQTSNVKKIKNEKKDIYGEYKNVRLSNKEIDTLFNDYGESETLEAIKYLDEYIEMKGYKAKSHYLCMRKWVFDAIKRDKASKPQSLAEKWGIINDD